MKKICFLSFVLLFIVSCSGAAEKKNELKPDEPGAKARKETSAKKATPDPAEKKEVPKWNVNAAAAQIKFSVKGPFGTVDGGLSSGACPGHHHLPVRPELDYPGTRGFQRPQGLTR